MGITANKIDDLVTIVLDPSFDVSQYEKFKSICESNVSDTNRFAVDFAQTEYIDSSALGMLLLLREQTKGDKSRVTLINVGGSALNILKIAQFNQLFTIQEV